MFLHSVVFLDSSQEEDLDNAAARRPSSKMHRLVPGAMTDASAKPNILCVCVKLTLLSVSDSLCRVVKQLMQKCEGIVPQL